MEYKEKGDETVAFEDGVGEVSGTWLTSRKPSAEIGILTYIMVDNAEETTEKILANGGEIIQPIGKDYPEITARLGSAIPRVTLWVCTRNKANG